MDMRGDSCLPAIGEWLARDEDGSLYVYGEKPVREMGFNGGGYWTGREGRRIDSCLFPDVRWDGGAVRVNEEDSETAAGERQGKG